MLDRANKSEPVGVYKKGMCRARSKQTGKPCLAPAERFGSAGCTVLAVARQRASGTEIIGMALARRIGLWKLIKSLR